MYTIALCMRDARRGKTTIEEIKIASRRETFFRQLIKMNFRFFANWRGVCLFLFCYRSLRPSSLNFPPGRRKCKLVATAHQSSATQFLATVDFPPFVSLPVFTVGRDGNQSPGKRVVWGLIKVGGAGSQWEKYALTGEGGIREVLLSLRSAPPPP